MLKMRFIITNLSISGGFEGRKLIRGFIGFCLECFRPVDLQPPDPKQLSISLLFAGLGPLLISEDAPSLDSLGISKL